MKTSFKIISLLFLIIAGCDNNPVNLVADEKFLKINFTDGYCDAEGWVVLHSEDGQAVIRTIQFTGDSLVDFGELEQGSVTITIITTDLIQGLKNYNLNTYYSVKKGTWTLSGNSISNLGDVTVQMNFPTANFDEILLSTAGSYMIEPIGSGSQTELISNVVTQLNQDQTISLYGSVRNYTANTGYYLWLPDQQFNIGNHNSYQMNLTKPLSIKRIIADKTFRYIDITGYTSQPLAAYRLFTGSLASSSLEHDILFPDEFPASRYTIIINEYQNNDYSYYYSKTTSSLVNNLSVPTYSITASYNTDQKQYENISLTGNSDYLLFRWYINNGSVPNRIFWNVNTSNAVTKVKIPVLPVDVTNQITGFDFNAFLPHSVGLYENTNYNNLDDYITGRYKSNNVNVQMPGEEFIYFNDNF